jgi:hypothetical protein
MPCKSKRIPSSTIANRPIMSMGIKAMLMPRVPGHRHQGIMRLVSVLLSQRVRDGALVRIKRRRDRGDCTACWFNARSMQFLIHEITKTGVAP